MITRCTLALAACTVATAAATAAATVASAVASAGPAGASPASPRANALGIDTTVHGLAGVAPVVYGHGTAPDTVTLYLSTPRGLVRQGSATPNDPSTSMGSRDFALKGRPLPAGTQTLTAIETTPGHAVVATVVYRLVVDPIDTRGCPSATTVLPVAKRATDATITGIVRTRCAGSYAVTHLSLADTGMSDTGGDSSPHDAFVLLHRSGSSVSLVGAAAACRHHQVPAALAFEACDNHFVTLGTFGTFVSQPER